MVSKAAWAALLAAGGIGGGLLAAAASRATVSAQAQQKLQYVMTIFQENKSFDSYFGTFPGSDGIVGKNITLYDSAGLPHYPTYAGNYNGGKYADLPPELPHSHGVSLRDIDNGKMDGFCKAEVSGTITDPNDPMLYWDGTQLPNYWRWASMYSLCQRMFASVIGPSFPNHVWLVAASSYYNSLNSLCSICPTTGWDGCTSSCVQEMVSAGLGNACPAPPYNGMILDNPGPGTAKNAPLDCITFDLPTIMDSLTSIGIRNSYYVGMDCTAGSYHIWRVPYYFKQYQLSPPPPVRNTGLVDSLGNLSQSQLLSDMSSGTLPSVSWVMPPVHASDHPPASIRVSQNYVTEIVKGFVNGGYWNNGAIILTWDDWGGFYDHVPPPKVDAFGYGIRVPCIILSPFVSRGFNNTNYDFTSIMKLIEALYGLPPLQTRDAAADNMLGAFNFSQSPLPPPC